MAISGNKRIRRDIDIDTLKLSEQDNMERLKPPLHNFNLPSLKWGNQKLLRCMNVDDYYDHNVSPSFVRRTQSPETSGSGGRSVIRSRRNEPALSSEELRSRIGVGAGDGGEIEATREKLMCDFKKEVDQVKVNILKEQQPVTTETTTTCDESPSERPWNLRTRRAACTAPLDGVKVSGKSEVLKPNSRSALTDESMKRKKFSVSLSRDELEDDFMVMTGSKLPRKPKKRPRAVQKQLDTLFPGLWLTEITVDMYKVPDQVDTRKR